MTRPLLLLALLASLLVPGRQAAAQITANGPYYATPSWDQQLPPAQRYVLLANWASQAVLDRETGLVWMRTPKLTGTITWYKAMSDCQSLVLGNRAGWRLPTISELTSLFDFSTNPPAQAPGSPFLSDAYADVWSATTLESDSTQAYGFYVSGGAAQATVFVDPKVAQFGYWCVRGP